MRGCVGVRVDGLVGGCVRSWVGFVQQDATLLRARVMKRVGCVRACVCVCVRARAHMRA